jgi:hypothetical protein
MALNRYQQRLAIAEFNKPGSYLVLSHGYRQRPNYRIEPSCMQLDEATAEILRSLPGVMPGRDGLFPHTSQTWRTEDAEV